MTDTEPRGCPIPGPTMPTVPPELIRALELAEAALADIGDAEREPGDDLAWAEARAAQDLPRIRAVLTSFGRPAIKPVPVAERFEFSVFNSEYEEQAGGTAPTYAQALSEGQHYLSEYSQDGPHSLEIRRVEVLPHYARAELAQSEPEGPTDEELIEPVRWILDDYVYDNDTGEIAQILRTLLQQLTGDLKND